MSNTNNNAYALTLLCPIKPDQGPEQSFASRTRELLQRLPNGEQSPMARVPNTYQCRLYILNDVFFEGSPAHEDHLKTRYLVFSCNFHGALETYLHGFWQHARKAITNIWQHCIGFDQVTDAESFSRYIKKCQVTTTYYFNGSSGAPLQEQLKALYLKQQFAEFVQEQQGKSAAEQQQAFQNFIANADPFNSAQPSWAPGLHSLP